MPFDEDLSVFFDAEENATTATLNGISVTGITEPGYQNASIGGYGNAGGPSPTFTLRSTDVPNTPEGKLLVISSGFMAGSYRVANALHDGSGVCTLELLA